MYERIRIENFRGITNLELSSLQQFNLFVGRNNCGKTSLLESIFLLSGPTNVELPIFINRFRDYHLLDDYSCTLFFNELNIDKEIRFHGDILSPKEHRVLTIKPLRESVDLTVEDNESYAPASDILSSPTIHLNGLVVSCELKKEGEKLQSLGYKIRTGKALTARFISMPPGFKTFQGIYIPPTKNFSDTPRRFNNIQIMKKEKEIIKILQKVEPQLIDLSIGADNILYCDMGFNRRLPLNVAGEGLKKILSVILAIYEASNGVVMIDEIENGLYHSNQEILWASIFEAAKAFDVQVFATTHSYENVRAFNSTYEKLGEKDDKLRLFRIEKDTDGIRAVDFDHEMLKTSLESDWEVR